ncbi:MAG TPA: hypothetical protein VEW68_03110 [Patescibacteria group bacterium]|nr:hypothetical protein [Patescibacteria group bacterium]
MAAVQGPFPQDALETNRAGRLTDAQRRGIRGRSRGFRKAELQFAVVFTVIGLLVWFAEGPARYANVKPLVGIGFLIIAGMLVVRAFTGVDRLTQDVRSGRVESVEGAIAKVENRVSGGGPGTTSYFFHVAGKRITVSRSEYEAAPDAGYVRVFYLPHSLELVNMERLADKPLAPDALKSPEVAQQLFQAMRSHDEVTAAEARAQAAHMESTMKAALQSGAVPPPAAGRDPRPLQEAILGSWSNAVMSVSFAADGTLSAVMPGGMRRSGHWSVDSAGNFQSDVTGPLTPAEAWVSGDELTVTIGGTGLTFQRVAG